MLILSTRTTTTKKSKQRSKSQDVEYKYLIIIDRLIMNGAMVRIFKESCLCVINDGDRNLALF